MLEDLNPITEETGQRILDAVNGADEASGGGGHHGTKWYNLKPMTEETGRRIIDAVAQSSRRNQEALDNRIKKFYANNLGETTLPDSDNGRIQNMIIYGRSVQDGTPTPDAPVEIQSVVNPVVTLSNGDSSAFQSASMPFTLRSIGDICDELIVNSDGTGKLIQRVCAFDLSSLIVRCSDSEKILFTSTQFDESNLYYGESVIIGTCSHLSVTKNSQIGASSEFSKGPHVSFYQGAETDRDKVIYVCVPTSCGTTKEAFLIWAATNNFEIIYRLQNPIVTDLTAEKVQTLTEMQTYYPVTNVTVTSDQLDGYAVFDYPISLAAGWNYVKQQIGDTREYIYDMDVQSALAYVNSEYAVALSELEV